MPVIAPVLFVATPCYGGQVAIEYLWSVLELERACREAGVGFHLELLEDDRTIARARARLAARFLARPEATHLLFIDADIAFSPQTALRLARLDLPVVGGVCPLKHLDWERVRAVALAGAPDLQAAALSYVVRFLPNPGNQIEIEDGLAKVAYCGTGFLMIRREALTRMAAAHPELVAELPEEGGRVAMLFEPMTEPQTGEHLSEDYAFCRRWRDLGGEIWADVESRFGHAGHAVFAGSLIQALKPAG